MDAEELLRHIDAARQKRNECLHRLSNFKTLLSYHMKKKNREKVKEIEKKIEEVEKEYRMWKEKTAELCEIWRREFRKK